MSFGFSVGDFLAVGQLSWKVYKKCKDSPGSYAELSNEVGALHIVMKETEELFSQQDLTAQQENRLLACQQGCGDVLKDLDRLLVKYESLGASSRRTFDRMGFGMQDMKDIRLRLNSNVSMLDAFNNASSHVRLEKKLNLLIAEVRAGKREGSVISTQTFDTTARNDQETWEALRRELEDIGISPGVITEKRQFIIAWFQEAVAAGELEGDIASDDSNSVISLHELEDPAGANDDDSISRREISSTGFEPSTTQRRAAPQSVPSASRHPRQPGDVSSSPAQKNGKSRLRVTYLFQKLLGRDDQFLNAAIGGDLTTIKKLLDKGVNIQTRGLRHVESKTALHLASKNGKETTVQFLLSSGADVHAKDGIDSTALHHAAASGNKRIVDMLLEQGADIESKAKFGGSALHWTAGNGHQDTARLLLDRGADIESRSSSDGTALMSAARAGHQDMVQLLLKKGAVIEPKDRYGNTALMYAAKRGRQDTAQLLLEQGADIELKNSDGNTALMSAARAGYQDVVQLLLKKGADIRSKNLVGDSALIIAASQGFKHMTRLLLNKGADIDSNSNGLTALMCAAKHGHQDTVRLLLEQGADIESSPRGSTALLYAACNGKYSTVGILLENGADIESKNQMGNTALIQAARAGYQITVQLLLDKGAQVNNRGANGWTARQWAKHHGHLEAARILINAGSSYY